MKLLSTVLGGLALIASADSLYAQQPSEFPIGVFTFAGNKVDYTQMDSLGLTWVQGKGWDGHASDLEMKPESRDDTRLHRAVRLSLQADPDWPKRFQMSPPPDTIIYLENATIYFYDKDLSRLKALGILP